MNKLVNRENAPQDGSEEGSGSRDDESEEGDDDVAGHAHHKGTKAPGKKGPTKAPLAKRGGKVPQSEEEEEHDTEPSVSRSLGSHSDNDSRELEGESFPSEEMRLIREEMGDSGTSDDSAELSALHRGARVTGC